MTLLLIIGSYFLWSLLKICAMLVFAIPSGIGLGIGFHFSKKFINWRYKKELEKKFLGDEVLDNLKGTEACPVSTPA
jgi:hypothetical protein